LPIQVIQVLITYTSQNIDKFVYLQVGKWFNYFGPLLFAGYDIAKHH